MKKLFSALLLCFTPFVAQAVPLKVVNVSAPAINCAFNPACTVNGQRHVGQRHAQRGRHGFSAIANL